MHIIRRSCYNDCQLISTVWFAYQDEKVIYENPFKFQLDSWKTDEEATKIMKEIVSPRILPINFTAGKDIPSYEFYNPSVAARQLGFGQVPPSPFFVGKVQFRGALNGALSYDRLKDLEPSADMALLADWQITPFVTTPFIQWWSECQEHRFCRVASLYCTALNENYQAGEDELQTKLSPTMSLNIFCLQLLTSTSRRTMIRTLQQSVEVTSRSTMPCRPINPISALTP